MAHFAEALFVVVYGLALVDARSWALDGNMATGFNSVQIRNWFGAIDDPRLVNAARDVLHAGVLSYGKPAETWDWRTGWCKESEKDNPFYGCPRGKNNVFPFPLEAFVDTVHAIGAGAAAISPNMHTQNNLADQLEFLVYTDALLRNTSKFPGATNVPKLLVELGGEAFWGKHTCMPGSTHSPCRWHNATVFGQEVDAWATAIRAALPARQDFAEHFFGSNALQCTATARILIPAECSAVS